MELDVSHNGLLLRSESSGVNIHEEPIKRVKLSIDSDTNDWTTSQDSGGISGSSDFFSSSSGGGVPSSPLQSLDDDVFMMSNSFLSIPDVYTAPALSGNTGGRLTSGGSSEFQQTQLPQPMQLSSMQSPKDQQQQQQQHQQSQPDIWYNADGTVISFNSTPLFNSHESTPPASASSNSNVHGRKRSVQQSQTFTTQQQQQQLQLQNSPVVMATLNGKPQQQQQNDLTSTQTLPSLQDLLSSYQRQSSNVSTGSNFSSSSRPHRRESFNIVGGVVLANDVTYSSSHPSPRNIPVAVRARSVHTGPSSSTSSSSSTAAAAVSSHSSHHVSPLAIPVHASGVPCTGDTGDCQSVECVLSNRVTALDVVDEPGDDGTTQPLSPSGGGKGGGNSSGRPKKNKHLMKDRERRAKIKHGVEHLRSLLALGTEAKTDQASIVHYSVTHITKQNDEIDQLKLQLKAATEHLASMKLGGAGNVNDAPKRLSSSMTSSNIGGGVLDDDSAAAAAASVSPIYRQLKESQIGMYRIALTGGILEINGVVEQTSGFHHSALVGRFMCGMPFRWILCQVSSRSCLQSVKQENSILQQMSQQQNYGACMMNDTVTSIHALPTRLHKPQLQPFFPSHCAGLPPLTSTDGGHNNMIAAYAGQQCAHLVAVLSNLPSTQGLKLLCRHRTAFGECLEAIVTVCLLSNSNSAADCIVMLTPQEQRRINNDAIDYADE